jgi:hypothetical protein
MKLPKPIKASDVLRHDKGRHRAIKNKRFVWQIYYAWKHELFWFSKVIKTEYQWMRREWFRWIEK